MTPETEKKREQLQFFINQVLKPHPAVKAVLGIGSIATGHMRLDSDIDAIIFLDPLDLYIAPAEAIWRPIDNTFHSIFNGSIQGISLDFTRLDWKDLANEEYRWSEGRLAELNTGWLAYDPSGQAASLIARRTAYPEELRLSKLDEAIIWLDQHLGGNKTQVVWENLGPLIAQDRLEAAYHYLVQALFAYNRQWRIWRNREMQILLNLPWLPENFEDKVVYAANPPALDYDGYIARKEALCVLFDDLLVRLIGNGEYSATPIDQAFIRHNEEPGRAWNIDEWSKFHQAQQIPPDEFVEILK